MSTTSTEMQTLHEQKFGAWIRDDSSLFNVACYSYLRQLFSAAPYDPAHTQQLRQTIFKDQRSISACNDLNDGRDYDPCMAYGDLYSQTLKGLERLVEQGATTCEKSWANTLNLWVYRAFVNDNQILEMAYDFIKPVFERDNQTLRDIERGITTLCARNKSLDVNKHTPRRQGSTIGRFKAFAARNYHPTFNTSLPSVRHYLYHTSGEPVELRLGTQGQRVAGVARVSPLFDHFLALQANEASEQDITHVYFNGLALDREKSDLEGQKEVALSRVLHDLEKSHDNVVVITLPADKGLMGHEQLLKTRQTLVLESVLGDLLSIAMEDRGSKQVIKDFYISRKARAKIFKNKLARDELDALLRKSCRALGLDGRQKISKAERQALWFHFCKYELTDTILQTLEPRYFNTSCKDGIDRGGAHSAYYNLIKSIDCGRPMTREEFEKALHAASTLVKGRGMNAHSERIWNVIDLYVEANRASLLGTEAAWLIDWRDDNRPNFRAAVKHTLDSVSKACQKGLEHYLDNDVAGAFFKNEGKNRAIFYQHLLNHADDEKCQSLCCYALLTHPTGPTLKACLLKSLGATHKQMSDVLAHVYNRFEALFDVDMRIMGPCLQSMIDAIHMQADTSATDSEKKEKVEHIFHSISKIQPAAPSVSKHPRDDDLVTSSTFGLTDYPVIFGFNPQL